MAHIHTPILNLYQPELDDTLGNSLVGFNANADILDSALVANGGSVLSLEFGGTGGTLVASDGGIVYSDADGMAILSGIATPQHIVMSSANSAPVWSTPTYPNLGTLGKVLIGDGTDVVLSTPKYPNASAALGSIIISDETDYIASTATYPNTIPVGSVLVANTANAITAVTHSTEGASRYLTNAEGVISWGSGVAFDASVYNDLSWGDATLATIIHTFVVTGTDVNMIYGDNTVQTTAASVSPFEDDTSTLGTAAFGWSDIFLASGALIDYDDGNVVLTHSSGVLTLTTGTLKITTPTNTATSVVTVDATQTLTNKTLTSPKINEAVALTTTSTKLNYLTSATGTTGTESTKVVFNTSPTLVTPILGVASGTSVDMGATTLYGSRAITVDTGGVLNIDIGSAAGDDFTVDVSKFVVEGDSGKIGIGVVAPVSLVEIQGGLTTTGAVLTLSSQETTTVINDILGRINFRSALDVGGGDALLAGASIAAIAESTFSVSVNETGLQFSTGASEVAVERMRIDHHGNVGIGTTGQLAKLAINGGLHVGGDSDPGDNNLTVDGNATIVGTATLGNVAFPPVITVTELNAMTVHASVAGKVLAIEGMNVYGGTRGAFADLVAGNKNWQGITSIGADLYACVFGGSIWKSTAGGAFTDLVTGDKDWESLTSIGNDLYASVYVGSIWKSTAGGAFTDLVTGDKSWQGITSIGADLYACVWGGSIWKSTAGGAFTDLVAGNKNWRSITSIGNDLYAAVYGGSIWKSTAGGAFTDLVAGNKSWQGITSIGADLYACVYNGSIWKSTAGGAFTDLVAGNKLWRSITAIGNDLYVAVYSGSIWTSSYTGNISVDGVLIAGGSTNYSQFAVDGELTLAGTARVKNIINMGIDGLSQGSTAPSVVKLGNWYGYGYGVNDDGYVRSFELPYDWDSTVNPILKIHWYINEAYALQSAEVKWQVNYSPTAETGEAVDGATTALDTGDINIPATAKFLIESPITLTGIVPEDVIGMSVKRIALTAGTAPTAEPVIVSIELEYTSNKLGEAT